MKKVIIFVFCVLLAVFGCGIPAARAEAAYNSLLSGALELHSDVVLLANVEGTDGVTVIYDKNSNVRTAPASLAKIITAMVVLENCADLSELVSAPAAAIRLLDNTGSSTAGIAVGEELTVKELLYCLLVKSANEAATILAEHIAGSQEAFVEKMNASVAALGCADTHMVNTHGLDEPDQYTTARDMLRITLHLMQNKTFADITSHVSYTLRATNKTTTTRELKSTNFVMNRAYKSYYQPDVTGVKTGSTTQAGLCVIAKASRNGYTYYAVILRGPQVRARNGDSQNGAFLDCKNIMNWAFENIRLVPVADPLQIVTAVPVALSRAADVLRLVPATEEFALLPAGVGAGSVLLEAVADSLPKDLQAPVKKGTVLGKARVLYAGNEIAVLNLVAERDIPRDPLLYAGRMLRSITSALLFRLIAAVLILMLLGYVLLVFYARKQKKKRRQLRVVNYRDVQNIKKRK